MSRDGKNRDGLADREWLFTRAEISAFRVALERHLLVGSGIGRVARDAKPMGPSCERSEADLPFELGFQESVSIEPRLETGKQLFVGRQEL